ncbi:hypothetical protein [Streptomyces afghaniensis]|uniref:hypothetical protein n=1 Tax=Streptomyces afghaniensis TaxID=66865 RepID=UPI00278A8E3E|nr:hypothetical protein [Streptomyces afghaniensis]MDQ1014288.1 hypothetical protein [Streptomyces afghaniensis]
MRSYGLGRRQFLATAVGVAAAWTQVSGNAIAAPQLKQASRDNSVRVWLTDVSADKWVAGQDDVLFKAKTAANPLLVRSAVDIYAAERHLGDVHHQEAVELPIADVQRIEAGTWHAALQVHDSRVWFR